MIVQIQFMKDLELGYFASSVEELKFNFDYSESLMEVVYYSQVEEVEVLLYLKNFKDWT